MTRQSGATLTTTFFLAVAVSRLASIFVSARVKPTLFMLSSLLICVGGATTLCFVAGRGQSWLQVGVAVMGVGWSSMFATGTRGRHSIQYTTYMQPSTFRSAVARWPIQGD